MGLWFLMTVRHLDYEVVQHSNALLVVQRMLLSGALRLASTLQPRLLVLTLASSFKRALSDIPFNPPSKITD
jgi:hypothetical protein